jgi:hypothetical protein
MKFVSLFGSNGSYVGNVGNAGNGGQQSYGNIEDMFNNSF